MWLNGKRRNVETKSNVFESCCNIVIQIDHTDKFKKLKCFL